MKNKLILLTLAICMATTLIAQEKKATFGIKVGLNVANIGSTGDKEFDNVKAKAGFNAGITLDYAFSKHWYLLTGLEYSVKGATADLGRSNDLKMTAAYALLPLCAGYNIIITDDMSIMVKLGPYFAYGLHGKTKLGSSEWNTFDEAMKEFDCGINLGVSFEWKKMSFGMGGEMGLLNIMEDGYSDAQSRNFTISVGYKF